MKILDTDHCIALLRGMLTLQGRVDPTEELAVTTISVGELAHGAATSARPAENQMRVDVLLAQMTILPYDEASARSFGILKADLERHGMRLSDLDLQIAATAMPSTSPLVTHTTRHVQRIPGLLLEDWLV